MERTERWNSCKGQREKEQHGLRVGRVEPYFLEGGRLLACSSVRFALRLVRPHSFFWVSARQI
jgi:hypothetical protein